MRFLIENGSNDLNNLGDIAMLQVCLERLREHWPGARLDVITRDPAALGQHLPQAQASLIQYPAAWVTGRTLLTDKWPDPARALLQRLEASATTRFRFLHNPMDSGLLEVTDALVHAGAGILTDTFAAAAARRFVQFEEAVSRGLPTGLFGQGIGPLTIPSLRRRAGKLLRQVDWISARDPVTHAFLLDELGVDGERVLVSGDDALVLGHRSRPAQSGQELGLSLRRDRYNEITRGDLDWLRSEITSPLAQDALRGRRFVPLAIHSQDRSTTDEVFRALPEDQALPWHDHRVESLLQSVGRCCLVISTTYHGAVFALSMGLPVICLFRSDYYRLKFEGLAELFPSNCRRLDLGHAAAADSLWPLVHSLLDSAKAGRPQLLKNVEKWIERSREGYRRFHRILAGR